MAYIIKSAKGKKIANELKFGDRPYKADDGSTWIKGQDGSIYVTQNGKTEKAYISKSYDAPIGPTPSTSKAPMQSAGAGGYSVKKTGTQTVMEPVKVPPLAMPSNSATAEQKTGKVAELAMPQVTDPVDPETGMRQSVLKKAKGLEMMSSMQSAGTGIANTILGYKDKGEIDDGEARWMLEKFGYDPDEWMTEGGERTKDYVSKSMPGNVEFDAYKQVKQALDSGDRLQAMYLTQKNWQTLQDNYFKTGINRLWGSTEKRMGQGEIGSVDNYLATLANKPLVGVRSAEVVSELLKQTEEDKQRAENWYHFALGGTGDAMEMEETKAYLEEKYPGLVLDLNRHGAVTQYFQSRENDLNAELAQVQQVGYEQSEEEYAAEMTAKQKQQQADLAMLQFVNEKIAAEQRDNERRQEAMRLYKEYETLDRAWQENPTEENRVARNNAARAYNDYIKTAADGEEADAKKLLTLYEPVQHLYSAYGENMQKAETASAEWIRSLPVQVAELKKREKELQKILDDFPIASAEEQAKMGGTSAYLAASKELEQVQAKLRGLQNASRRMLDDEQKNAKTGWYAEMQNADDFEQYRQKGESGEAYAQIAEEAFAAYDRAREAAAGRTTLPELSDEMKVRRYIADEYGLVAADLYLNGTAEKMNDEEVALYHYILGKYGMEKAVEYLDYMQETFNRRTGEERAAYLQSLPAVFEVPLGMGNAAISGVQQFGQGLRHLLADEQIPATAAQVATGIMTQEDGLAADLYQSAQTVGNMLVPVLVSAGISLIPGGQTAAKVVGSALMGASSAGNAKRQALDEGWTMGQAVTYGLLVGGSEAALQYVLGGIGSLGGLTDDALLAMVKNLDDAFMRVALTGAIKLGSEITEEEVQLWLEPLFRTLVSGEVYKKPTTEEMWETAVLTAISTGMMEGVSIAKSGRSDYAKLGRDMKKLGGYTEATLETALQMGSETESYKMALEIVGAPEKATNKQMGQLFETVVEEGTDPAQLSRLALQKYIEQETAKADVKEFVGTGNGVEQMSIKNTRLMNWADQVKGYFQKNGSVKSSDSLFLGVSDQRLVAKGIASAPLYIPTSVINKATRLEKGSRSAHRMTENDFEGLQDKTQTAPAVIYNPSRNALVYITDQKIDNRGYVVLTFDMNNDLFGENAHKATSIHPRESIEGLLNNLGEDATIYVFNEKKLNDMLPGTGIQSSQLLAHVELLEETVSKNDDSVNNNFATDAEDSGGVPGLYGYKGVEPARWGDFALAEKLAKRFGAKLQVSEFENRAQGSYKDGVITLAPETEDPVMAVLVHELTHHMENSGKYDAFAKAVLNFAQNEMGANLEQGRKEVMEQYAAEGEILTEDGATRELVAKYAQQYLFKDERAIRRLVQAKPSVGEWIHNFLQDLRTIFKGTKYERFMLKAETMYKKALEDVAKKGVKPTGVTQHSLKIQHTNGNVEEIADARNLTREEAESYLKRAKSGELRRDAYIPVRKDTPQVVIDTMSEIGEQVENRSMLMQVLKAQQAMSENRSARRSGKHGSNIRSHALTEGQIVEIMEKLDNPSMAIYQTNRTDAEGNSLPNNVVFFVEYGDNGNERVAVIEFDSSIDPRHIGTEYGDMDYHTVVTVFEPDVERDGIPFDYAEELLTNPNNFELEIIRRQPEGSATGAIQPNTSNELPSYNTSISNPTEKSNPEVSPSSSKTQNSIGSSFSELTGMEKAEQNAGNFPWIDEAMHAVKYSEIQGEDRIRYNEAKAGTIDASAKLIEKFVTAENVEKIRSFGPDVYLLPIMGKPGTSNNVIPAHLANHFCEMTGQKLFDYIYQQNRVGHRNISAEERLFGNVHVEFDIDGEIDYADIKGKKFLIIDDNTSYGSTIRSMEEFLRQHGGIPVGAFTLSVGGDSASVLTATQETWNKLERIGIEYAERYAKEKGYSGEFTREAVGERLALALVERLGTEENRTGQSSTVGGTVQTGAARAVGRTGTETGRRVNTEQHSIGSSFSELTGMEKAEQSTDALLDEVTALEDDGQFSGSEEDERARAEDLDEYFRLLEETADRFAPPEAPDPADKVSVKAEKEKTPLGQKAKDAWSYLKRKMVDSGDAVAEIGRKSGDKHLYHYYNMARASSQAGVHMITDAQTDIYGRRVGKSLNEILNPIRKKGDDYYRNFQLFLFHRHNIDRMSRESQAKKDETQMAFDAFMQEHPELNGYAEYQIEQMAMEEMSPYYFEAGEYIALRDAMRRAAMTKNLPVFGHEVGAAESRAAVQTLQQRYPEFEALAEEVYGYTDNLMRYRVDSGLITEADYQALKRIYPHYVPTYREMEKAAGKKRMDGVQIGKTIGRAQGGETMLMPLHKALAQQTMSVVREGSKNRFAQRLMENSDKTRHITHVEEYAGDFNENTFDDPNGEVLEKKSNVFRFRQDGKVYEMEVTPALFEAVQALSPESEEVNAFTNVVRKTNDLYKRLITGWNPVFLTRNFVKDLQDAAFYSKDLSAFAANYPLAWKEIATNGEYWQLYKALGGTYTSVYDYETGTAGESGRVKRMMNKMELVNQFVEQAPRLAEFMATLKKHGGLEVQKNTAGGGKITAESTEQERYALLKGKKLTAAEVDYSKLQDEDMTQYETRKKSAVEPPILKLARKLGITDINLKQSQLDFPFHYSVKNIKRSLHHQLEYGGKYSAYAKALSCIDELVQKAVLVETHGDYKVGTDKANPDLKQVYVLMSLMRDGDSVVPMVFEVKEFYEREHGLYLTVALKEIDSAVFNAELTGKPGSMPHLFAESTADSAVLDTGLTGKPGYVPHLFTESTISIEDVFENVNPADGEFLKYVPDEFLNEEQLEAKKKAVERRVAKYGEQARPKRNQDLTAKTAVDMDVLMEAMYNAADITVNFGRSGTLGKKLNANYIPFFNPGIQGFSKMVRSVTETKGVKNWLRLITKAALLGFAPALINDLLCGDDEEWDDIKQSDKDLNYLIKLADGLWLKIPKGRTLSVLGMASDRVAGLAKGDEVDWGGFIRTAASQTAPANPLNENILKAWFDADLMDAESPGKTWYGGDIESQRLQGYAPGQRYDAKTDMVSKWLGQTFDLSPKKINYLLDQYTGVVGDVLLPMLTPTAERDMFSKAFTIDTTASNRLSGDFYKTLDELTYAKNRTNAKGTDAVMYRFWNKQASAIGEVNAAIREIEADESLSSKEKKQLLNSQYAIRNEIIRNAEDAYDDYEAAVEKYFGKAQGTRDEKAEYAYLMANRDVLGAEYALLNYNKTAYGKAVELNEQGVSYDDSLALYLDFRAAEDMPTEDAYRRKRDIVLQSGLTEEGKIAVYESFVSDSKGDDIEAFAAAGLSFDDFLQYEAAVYGLKSDDTSQKKEKVMAVIDAMDITDEQKDAVYVVAGYSEKTIHEAPWHKSATAALALPMPGKSVSGSKGGATQKEPKTSGKVPGLAMPGLKKPEFKKPEVKLPELKLPWKG